MLTLQEVLGDFRRFARLPDGVPVDAHSRSSKGETALHFIAGMGDRNAIKILVDAGADIDAADYSGNTPLHEAVKSCQFQGVRQLLALGADRSRCDASGRTPADMAAGIEYLLDEFKG